MTRYNLFAPAKVNLDLTITGKRPDGYHTLRSHVAFADCGDDLTMDIETSDIFSCTLIVDGAFSSHIAHVAPEANLVVKAAAAFARQYTVTPHIQIHLTKHLPSGAGLGGGSSDAAAVLRALVTHYKIDDATEEFKVLCLSLGADVPVCYHAAPCVMEGIGEILSPWTIHDSHALLIWPGTGPSTKALYAAFDANPVYQGNGGNDFQPVAMTFCPDIAGALDWLKNQPKCRKAQLSGSGTAVFGLYDTAPNVAENIDFPWFQLCTVGFVKKPLVSIAGTG